MITGKKWPLVRVSDFINYAQNVKIPNFEPKNLMFFLLKFSIATFHLEIVSANMTFTNQSMIIHIKDIYRRQCNVIRVENISIMEQLQKSNLIFLGLLLKISTFQTSVTKPNTLTIYIFLFLSRNHSLVLYLPKSMSP